MTWLVHRKQPPLIETVTVHCPVVTPAAKAAFSSVTNRNKNSLPLPGLILPSYTPTMIGGKLQLAILHYIGHNSVFELLYTRSPSAFTYKAIVVGIFFRHSNASRSPFSSQKWQYLPGATTAMSATTAVSCRFRRTPAVLRQITEATMLS